jgi:DNA ligase-associated metallophosphoesterase
VLPDNWKSRLPVLPECLEIQLCGERLQLHQQRALLWPARATLVIADPHFGKDDIFRRAGIALPRGPAIADLQRLSHLIAANGCTRLVVLGDFLHGATQAADSFRHAFRVWRRAHGSLTVDVVVGNHDRREPAHTWQQLVGWHTRPLVEPPFVLAHEPAAHTGGYVLAGHIHPVLRLRRRSSGGVRVPVFWQRRDYLVLPSFGSLTGGAEVTVELGDLLYAAGPERVFPVPVGVPSSAPGQ